MRPGRKAGGEAIDCPSDEAGGRRKARKRATSKRTSPTPGSVRDSLLRGEAADRQPPLYTQPGVLKTTRPDERQLGIEAGLHWRLVAEASVVYQDLGIAPGMRRGIQAARAAGIRSSIETSRPSERKNGAQQGSRAPLGEVVIYFAD